MPNDSVNIEKHIQTYLLNTFVITENAELRKKLGKIKYHKHLRQLTLHQLQLHTIIIKSMNTFEIILLVIHLVMTACGDYIRISKYSQRLLEIFDIFKLGWVFSKSVQNV
jgi:hypothetical protein